MFRPQWVVEGISREAQDQYLYMAQDTWSKGSYIQAKQVARWQNGGFGRIDGIDNSIENRIQLQRVSELSLEIPMEVEGEGEEATATPNPTRLVDIAGWLLAFSEDGTVQRLGDPVDGWEDVDYDAETHGAVCFCDVATTSGGGHLTGQPGFPESSVRLLLGTVTGKVFMARIELVGGTTPTVTPIDVQAFGTTRILHALAYRNQIVVAVGNKVLIRPIAADGTWQSGDTLDVNCPGAPITMAVWNQAVMIGVQASSRGSIIIAANINQAADTYRVDGGFAIQSMTTWGGQLVYGGKAFRSSEVYTFPGTLADRLPPGATPTDVLAMVATHRHLLVGWNGKGGIWWIHDKGSGALCQYGGPPVVDAGDPEDFVGIHRRVRSIAIHRGEVFYTLDDVGVIRIRFDEYRSTGTITSGWFDGGFPELLKNYADIFVRLQHPLKETETVTVSARVDGLPEEVIGTIATGRVYSTFPIPAALQQGKRINIIVTMTSDTVPPAVSATTTPVINAVVLRYRPIPFQQRVWGFTVRVGDDLMFLDQSRERRTPGQILADLFTLPNAGQVDFATVLETDSRKVYVTNVEMKDQLMGRSRSENEECFVAVEILEASAQLDNTEIDDPPQEDPEDLPLDDPDSNNGDRPGQGSGPPGTPEDREREWEVPVP